MGALSLGAVVLPLVLWVAAIWLGVRGWQSWQRRARGGGEDLWPSADPTRLVLASLVLKGGLFRQSILRELRNPFLARAPEPGLDMPLIEAVCLDLERGDRVFQWAIVVIVLLGLLAGPFMALLALVLIGLCLYMSWRGRFQLAREFRRENYDREALRRRYNLPPPSDDEGQSGTPVIVHGTSEPFGALGVRVDGWIVQADTDRAAEGATISSPPSPELVEREVNEALAGLKIPGCTLGEVIFCSGVESERLPDIQASRFDRPNPSVPDDVAARFRHQSTPAARTYRTATVQVWQGELIFTYGFRAIARGNALSFEAVQLLTTPIAAQYRAIDRQRRLSAGESILWGMTAVAMVPLQVMAAFVGVFAHLSLLLGEIIGNTERRERREISLNPAYNYGSRWSLRTTVADAGFQAWFQKVDVAQIARAMNDQALNAVIDVLQRQGIDVSRLVAQANIIQTTNVQITGGGSVNLAGAAIGAGATAQAGSPVNAAALAARMTARS